MGFNFLQIADCYIDRSTQVNFEVRDVGLGSSIAKRDNFGTQCCTPQSPQDASRTPNQPLVTTFGG